MQNIAIIAALPEEADAIFENQGSIVDTAPLPIRLVKINDINIHIATCGIGKVHASIAATFMIGAYLPGLIIMTGTCGNIAALPDGAYWISGAQQHDYGTLRSSGMTRYRGGTWPMGEPKNVAFTPMDKPKSLNIADAVIGTGDMFVSCPDHAQILRDAGIELVDMEVAAMAQVAHAFNIPWAAVKAISDNANDDSPSAFRANLHRAAKAAAIEVEKVVIL
ncbi:hypothetical protein LPB140_11005 [Sphingorhabdus lutea]|uniref:Nucleoside phosphorylase domain-containing protein n=1 Tax=Sphingorhabdus lutea TaxID=1913578 RepID=A0A1L3JDL6_9SPHN|nr:5'-methylthioadenosine/S-adenosylhomocysteine nucleosidase [Sphingorhabdus lutea]APG63225.1 hypothetical protein LPB140_11005 [Sphingorhabdus lutea]